MIVCETELKVRYNETGQNGIAHHSNYYNWFDIVQEEFLRKNGYTYDDLAGKGLFFPHMETKCRFFCPVRHFENIVVKMSIQEMGEVKCIFEYEVTGKEDGRLIAKAEVVQAFVNEKMKPTALKKALPELYILLKSNASNKV